MPGGEIGLNDSLSLFMDDDCDNAIKNSGQVL